MSFKLRFPLIAVLATCLLAGAAGLVLPPRACAQVQNEIPQSAVADAGGNHATDLRAVASGYRSKGDYDRAIEAYTSLLATNPADAISIKVDLGICYKAKRDYANAVPLFTEAASSPSSSKARAMFYIEDCLCEQGKIADAVVELSKAYAECPEARAEVLLRRATRQCDIRKYKEALADYQEFMVAYPEKKELIATFSGRLPEIKLRAAGIYDGPSEPLATELGKAADPAYVKVVRSRLAECCLRERKWAAAIPHYEAMLSDYPDREAAIKVNLATCYKGTGDYAKAIALFTEVAGKSASLRRNALVNADECLLKQGKKAESIEFMTKISSDYPEIAGTAIPRRALRRYQLGQYADALADYRKCVTDYKYGADQIRSMQNRIDELRLRTANLLDGSSEAISTELTRAQSANEDASYIKLLKLRLGESLLREQKWTQAKSHLQSLLTAYPSDVADIKMSLGFCHRGMKDYDGAIAVYQEIAAGDSPRKLDAIFCIRYAMIEQGKTREAAAYFADLDTAFSEVSGQVLLKRAILEAEETRDDKAALADLRKFVADNPDDKQAPWAKLQIAGLLLHIDRKPSDARPMLQQFITDYPNYVGMIEARSILAECSYVEADYAAAAELYKAAYEFPDVRNYRPFVLYMMGDCYSRTGAPDKATEAWNKLAEQYPKSSWAPVATAKIAKIQSQKEGK